jgi:hypothetical protein
MDYVNPSANLLWLLWVWWCCAFPAGALLWELLLP